MTETMFALAACGALLLSLIAMFCFEPSALKRRFARVRAQRRQSVRGSRS